MSDKLLMILVTIVILAIIGSITFITIQPNDLRCKQMIWSTGDQELLLVDCHHPNNEATKTYTVKVVFEK